MTPRRGRQRPIELSEYRGVWLFAMFDLPVDSKESRRHYARFRGLLLKLGFEMMQFSVYRRYLPSEEASDGLRRKIRTGLPPDGSVALLLVTDKQFGKMEHFLGKKRRSNAEPPDQLQLF